jgi:hypothetical protein
MDQVYRRDEDLFEAMKIYAICVDAEISDAEIRLLTYIHFKITANNGDYHCFEKLQELDCASI